MRFLLADLKDAVLIELEKRSEPHGFFARTFCEEAFGRVGRITRYVQTNASGTPRAGTLRGLHYQVAPCEEVKAVRCHERRDLGRNPRSPVPVSDLSALAGLRVHG